MKKEKWMLREIERWQREEIINTETADILKKQYEPKKSLGFLIVLFSIIGTLFIGVGIILIGANNWWYRLPVAVRTAIAFLPLVASQVLLFYVLRYKIHSTAFREGSAILNMVGVFSSIAIVGQIFHLPGDFTNYILVCGVLSLPSMLATNAVAPMIIYYWTVINGGLYFSDTWGLTITIILYAIGVGYAVYNFRGENGKAVYMAWITIISGFILMLSSALWAESDPVLILFAYFALLLVVSPMWEKAGQPLKIVSTSGVLVLLAVTTYQALWMYNVECENVSFVVLTAALTLTAIIFAVKGFINRKKDVFTAVTLFVLLVRIIWAYASLNDEPFDIIFVVMINIIMFATGIYFIWMGVKNVNLFVANIGMVTVCVFTVMRFFDSGMSLAARGVAFLIFGAGFCFSTYALSV